MPFSGFAYSQGEFYLEGVATSYAYSSASGSMYLSGSAGFVRVGAANGSFTISGYAADRPYAFASGDLYLSGYGYTTVEDGFTYGYGFLGPLQGVSYGRTTRPHTVLGDIGFVGYAAETAYGRASSTFNLTGTSEGTYIPSIYLYGMLGPIVSGTARPFVNLSSTGYVESQTQTNLGQLLSEAASASTAVQTFWNPQAEIADNARAQDVVRLALTTLIAEAASAEDALPFSQAIMVVETARALTQTQTFYNAVVALTDVANSLDYASYADVQDVAETANAVDEALLVLTRIAQIMDEATAEDSVTPLLHLMVALSDEAAAEDEPLSLRHLIALIEEDADAWVSFKFSDEAYTGWVMNTDGERPLSEYQGFNFNSFAEIGGKYYGAADDGLYLLEGDDDAGTPIDASIKTMMIDFGSSQQKRVRSAYLGYTATGKLLLKVRAVDEGTLKEHWYEAQELTAQAPREQMVRIGRGLRSRYWQFELVNLDGADFELDVLELHPVVLNRRV